MSDNWRNNALCKGKDTEMFYPEMSVKGAIKAVRAIKAICRMCPVAVECLQCALDNNETFGIWGGMTPKERTQIRKNKIPAKDIAITIVKKNDNSKV